MALANDSVSLSKRPGWEPWLHDGSVSVAAASHFSVCFQEQTRGHTVPHNTVPRLSSRQTPGTSEEPLGRAGHSTSDTCQAGPGGKPRGHLKGMASSLSCSSAATSRPCSPPAQRGHSGPSLRDKALQARTPPCTGPTGQLVHCPAASGSRDVTSLVLAGRATSPWPGQEHDLLIWGHLSPSLAKMSHRAHPVTHTSHI